MTHYDKFSVAAIQSSPIFLDRDASTDKAFKLIKDASSKGAVLAAFGEAWLPGYPFFNVEEKSTLYWKAASEYLANAVEIPSPTTDRLCDAAKQSNIDVVIGIVELDKKTKGTAYCTLLFIGNNGQILGRHRKLKPTCIERAIWGDGDSIGLTSYDRSYGRISGLNCWEHNMVLPGYALMEQGTQIHVAAWPGSEPISAPESPNPIWARQLLLSRSFASQSGSYVILVGGLRSKESIPDRYSSLSEPFSPSTGDSCIIDPRGEIIAGPANGETILLSTISLESVFAAKSACDVAGHYSRPDIFNFSVNNQIK